MSLMTLRINNPLRLSRLNRRRALFVLSKIDAILAWEQRVDGERDTRFVDLGRYLCEVRAGQYWRVENMKSFDEFLEPRFQTKSLLPDVDPRISAAPDSSRAEAGGMDEGGGTNKSGSFGRSAIRLCNLVAQSP